MGKGLIMTEAPPQPQQHIDQWKKFAKCHLDLKS